MKLSVEICIPFRNEHYIPSISVLLTQLYKHKRKIRYYNLPDPGYTLLVLVLYTGIRSEKSSDLGPCVDNGL